jgi:hypothetical protein
VALVAAPARSALVRAALAMAVLGAFYLLLAVAFPGQMGFGDVKLAGLLGLFLGFLGWPTGAAAALLASSLGSLVSRHARRDTKGRVTIALGPYLCLARWSLCSLSADHSGGSGSARRFADQVSARARSATTAASRRTPDGRRSTTRTPTLANRDKSN